MSKFVRKSKFRHVFAGPPKREHCWDPIKLTKQAWDSNWMSCNPLYIAVAWQVGGGGAVGILDANNPGKLDNVPLFTGHKGPILDLEFSPFNDDLIATVSEDCYGKIWQIPSGGLKENVEEPVQVLKGHKRKVGTVNFNPVADNILATSAQDYEVKIWDVSTGADKGTIVGHGNIIQSVAWNYDGSLLCTCAKDKKVRVIDPRSSQVTGEAEAHVGVKGGRALWLGKHNLFMSVGFGKTAERQYIIWDPRKMAEPLAPASTLDNSAGVLMPFYDEDSDILFLAGKGDGNIRYFEIVPEEEPKKMVYLLSQFSSNEPTAAMCALAKRGCDVSSNEIIRLYKATGTTVQPLKFQVPRKSDMFQDDIFPPCRSDEPALSAADWLSGSNATPKLKSLEGGFQQKEKSDVVFEKAAEEKELSADELKKAYEQLQKRVAYLEAELAKKDAQIKELTS